MLSEAELDRVCVVLVRARNPSNIGAVARAMHDFGFSRLRVVNEFAAPFEGARSAVDASEVLARAVRCASVAEAVADCTLVAGTTAVGERNLRHKLLELPEAAPLIRAELRRSEERRVGSDWSSDVCSSDLGGRRLHPGGGNDRGGRTEPAAQAARAAGGCAPDSRRTAEIGRASCRE